MKHVAGIMELYLGNCICKGRFSKKGNVILLHGVNNIRDVYIDLTNWYKQAAAHYMRIIIICRFI